MKTDTPIRAVVTDDNDIDRYLVSRVLNKSTVIGDVHEFVDGDDLELFLLDQRGGPSFYQPFPPATLFLIDINMPRMDGLTLLRSMQDMIDAGELNKLGDCVVYMLTSSSYEGDRLEALAHSFVKGFAQKPLSKEKLEQIVEESYPDLSLA